VNVALPGGPGQSPRYLPSNSFTQRREDFGLRWQSASGDTAFDCGQCFQSGVALRFPPHSKKFALRLCVFALKFEPLVPQANQKGLAAKKHKTDTTHQPFLRLLRPFAAILPT